MSEGNVTIDQLLGKKDFKKVVAKMKFEDGLAVLEDLVTRVEGGRLPLDKSLEAYEVASELVSFLRGLLGEAEGKLKTIHENAAGEIGVKEA
jgi:exodeoxyribonuclease VII small subunit